MINKFKKVNTCLKRPKDSLFCIKKYKNKFYLVKIKLRKKKSNKKLDNGQMNKKYITKKDSNLLNKNRSN